MQAYCDIKVFYTDDGYIGLEAAMAYCYYEECDCNWAWIDGSQFMFMNSAEHNPTQFVSGNLGGCGVLTNGESYESQACSGPKNYFCHFMAPEDPCHGCDPAHCHGKNKLSFRAYCN